MKKEKKKAGAAALVGSIHDRPADSAASCGERGI
jgi:hypothetical protein